MPMGFICLEVLVALTSNDMDALRQKAGELRRLDGKEEEFSIKGER